MKRKLITAVIMLGLINFGTHLAAADLDLAGLKSKISRVEDAKIKVAGLEKQLNGLKIDARNNMWNFIGRAGNEKTIQKRSRIQREISSLSESRAALIKELLGSRPALAGTLGKNAGDENFRYVLDYLDGLAAAEVLGVAVLGDAEINSAAKDPGRAEFLGYKAGLQAKVLTAAEGLISHLKAKKKAYQEANTGLDMAGIDRYIGQLGDMRDKLIKSQAAIAKALK